MNQDRFWELVSIKLAGEATPEELAELETFLQENSAEGIKLEKLHELWETRHRPLVSQKERSAIACPV